MDIVESKLSSLSTIHFITNRHQIRTHKPILKAILDILERVLYTMRILVFRTPLHLLIKLDMHV